MATGTSALFNFKKGLNLFGREPETLAGLGVSENDLPKFARSERDGRGLKSWSPRELPLLGEKIGFLKKPAGGALVASVFVTKGGVLKSSLSLNLARMAALHGIRTCVIGLDMQSDITTALSGDEETDDQSLSDAIARMNEVRGLADFYVGSATLEQLVKPTDIPTLSFIPETAELVALDQSLMSRNRREFWLSEQVIAPLKHRFDLIVLDCSPNWNRLITNALVASDVLISPLECKINNFRNLAAFRALMGDFKSDMRVDFSHIFVPTRLASGRKLSQEIFSWYRENLPQCTTNAVRESAQGEESIAMRQSIPEYAPTSPAAAEMRAILEEIWNMALTNVSEIRSKRTTTHSAKELAL